MELKINLATRYFVDARKFSAVTISCAVLMLLVLWYLVATIAGNAGREKRLTADIAAFQARFSASARGVSEKDYDALLKRITAANGIIRKKSFDWLVLLDRLEAAVPNGVALASVDPSPKDGSLKITGITREFRGLREFVENLESTPQVSDVFLQSQSETAVGATQKGISFTVICKVQLS
ncbi:PilN domain-containing protein [Geobacter pickeringii]|uniref:Fimbrial protein n=1 Tax=Geobacter pickeringii TaxID=345632 RepID=A0A0B5BF59_9BACT|nr:PilN domain-containing protein [Geobacter pickeringii]AJE03170.1 fimbrial protein [Geobacter pickeringii]